MLSTVVLSNENQTCRGWEAPTSIGGGGCHGIMSSITYGGNFLDKMISVLVLQIVLLILNAIFSSAEISVISLNEAKVKQMAEEGDKRAEKAAMLLKKPGEVP